MVSDLGEERILPRRTGQGQALFGRHSAAERDWHPAHGPRPQPDHTGRAGALAPHERLQHPLAAGHGPCRHRDAERGREGPAQGRQTPPGPRARGFCGQGVGMEEAVRRDDRPPAAHAGQLHGLAARTLHVRRGLLQGRRQGVHAALRRRSHIQGQLYRQLVSALRHRPRQRRSRT